MVQLQRVYLHPNVMINLWLFIVKNSMQNGTVIGGLTIFSRDNLVDCNVPKIGVFSKKMQPINLQPTKNESKLIRSSTSDKFKSFKSLAENVASVKEHKEQV